MFCATATISTTASAWAFADSSSCTSLKTSVFSITPCTMRSTSSSQRT